MSASCMISSTSWSVSPSPRLFITCSGRVPLQWCSESIDVKIVELYWPAAAPGRWWTRSRPCQTPGMPPLSPPCWNQRINEHFITNSIFKRTSSSSFSWLPLPRRWCYRCGAGAGARRWRWQEAGGARSLCSRNGINNNYRYISFVVMLQMLLLSTLEYLD